MDKNKRSQELISELRAATPPKEAFASLSIGRLGKSLRLIGNRAGLRLLAAELLEAANLEHGSAHNISARKQAWFKQNKRIPLRKIEILDEDQVAKEDEKVLQKANWAERMVFVAIAAVVVLTVITSVIGTLQVVDWMMGN